MATRQEEKLAYIDSQMGRLQELAGTITSSIASLEPTTIIQGYIERAALASLVAMNVCRVNRDLIGSSARSLIVGSRGTITAVASVSEGADITLVNPTWTPYTLTPVKYAVGVEVTTESVNAFQFDVVNSWLEEAGYAMGKAIDTAVLTELRTATSVGSANAATSGNLAYDDVIGAVVTVRGLNYDPDTLIINSAQAADLLKDTKFINASAYGDRGPILNGEIGQFAGLKVLVTSQASSGTALVLDSKRAAIVAVKRDLTVKRQELPQRDSIGLYVTEMIYPKTVNVGAVCVIHGC